MNYCRLNVYFGRNSNTIDEADIPPDIRSDFFDPLPFTAVRTRNIENVITADSITDTPLSEFAEYTRDFHSQPVSEKFSAIRTARDYLRNIVLFKSFPDVGYDPFFIFLKTQFSNRFAAAFIYCSDPMIFKDPDDLCISTRIH